MTDNILSRLKRVRLRGFGGVEVYANATLSIETVNICKLLPTQTYVLKKTADVIRSLATSCAVDIFHLDGGLMLNGIPFLPPIVEESCEGLILNDGMHRVWVARERGDTINTVVVRGVPPEYPYYAYPLENGWNEVTEVDVRPEIKKRYRDPENYKALFRDFNAVFPGVQEDRK